MNAPGRASQFDQLLDANMAAPSKRKKAVFELPSGSQPIQEVVNMPPPKKRDRKKKITKSRAEHEAFTGNEFSYCMD